MYTNPLAKAILLVLALLFIEQFAWAQTDVPRIISYQGQLSQTDGTVSEGEVKLTVRFYTSSVATTPLWEDDITAQVKNGVFSVLLGGGKPLPEPSQMDRPLWIGVSVNGTTELRPLTQLTANAYALNIPDKSITKSKLSDEVLSAISLGKKSQDPQTANSAVYWSETGNNSTTPGTNYVGTSDNVALELHVYDGDGTANRGSKRVMKYEPNATSANITGGYQGNKISSTMVGSAIGGGGKNSSINEIRSNYSTIGGGRGG